MKDLWPSASRSGLTAISLFWATRGTATHWKTAHYKCRS